MYVKFECGSHFKLILNCKSHSFRYYALRFNYIMLLIFLPIVGPVIPLTVIRYVLVSPFMSMSLIVHVLVGLVLVPYPCSWELGLLMISMTPGHLAVMYSMQLFRPHTASAGHKGQFTEKPTRRSAVSVTSLIAPSLYSVNVRICYSQKEDQSRVRKVHFACVCIKVAS